MNACMIGRGLTAPSVDLETHHKHDSDRSAASLICFDETVPTAECFEDWLRS